MNRRFHSVARRIAVSGALCAVLAYGAVASAADAVAKPKETLPAEIKLAAVEVQPTSIDLGTKYAYAQVLVTGRLASGEQIDLTRMATVSGASELVSVSPTGVVRPKADGAGELKWSVAGKTLSVPVKVAGLATAYEVSFVRDVMPTLSKMGCNAGTCHGSLNGKNGFKLSLRGYDPLFDHRALTDDIAGRRFNRAAPDQSLMLLKPAGVIPHVGGVLTQPGAPYYELLRAWIAGGVKLDLDAPASPRSNFGPRTRS